MSNGRRPATTSPKTGPMTSRGDDLSLTIGWPKSASAVPDVKALGEFNAKIAELAQQMMTVTYHRPEGSTLVEISELLTTAGSQLAEIERRSHSDRRLELGLAGTRTALLTAIRELRNHLIRHGWAVDDVAEWSVPVLLAP